MIPKHFKKFLADYQSKKITDQDVVMTGDPENPMSLEFEITLPTFDEYGDALGTHTFKTSVESLVSTKQRANAQADAVIAATDLFNEDYDAMLAALNEIKNAKKME